MATQIWTTTPWGPMQNKIKVTLQIRYLEIVAYTLYEELRRGKSVPSSAVELKYWWSDKWNVPIKQICFH